MIVLKLCMKCLLSVWCHQEHRRLVLEGCTCTGLGAVGGMDMLSDELYWLALHFSGMTPTEGMVLGRGLRMEV